MISAATGLMLFRKLVKADSATMAMLRGGIHIERVPADKKVAPWATLSIITTSPTDTKDGVSCMDEVQIQLDVWANLEDVGDSLTGYRAAAEAEQSIRDVVDGFMGDVEGITIDEIRYRTHNATPFEDDRDMYRVSVDYIMRIKRLAS
jgi:hypothetical protein